MSVLTQLKDEAFKFRLSSGALDPSTEESDGDESVWDDQGVEMARPKVEEDKDKSGMCMRDVGIGILSGKSSDPQRLQGKLKALFENMQMVS